MRFYVASGLSNRDQAMDMIRFLSSRGHTPTYDWTEHGDVRGQGLDRLQMVATSETSAVRDAEFVLVLLPGGQGTHTELGIALATRANKRIMLWSETGKEFLDNANTCVFYHHMSIEQVTCSYQALKAKLCDCL